MEIKPLNPVSINTVCLALFLPSGETMISIKVCPLTSDPTLTGTSHVPTSLKRGSMSYSHQMEKLRGILFERQSDGVFAGIGYRGVSVGYVDRDEFSVRSFFQLRTIFFTIDRLAAFRDVLARRSRTNKLCRHSVLPFHRNHTTPQNWTALRTRTLAARCPGAGFASGASDSSGRQPPNFHNLKITSRRRATSASPSFSATQ